MDNHGLCSGCPRIGALSHPARHFSSMPCLGPVGYYELVVLCSEWVGQGLSPVQATKRQHSYWAVPDQEQAAHEGPPLTLSAGRTPHAGPWGGWCSLQWRAGSLWRTTLLPLGSWTIRAPLRAFYCVCCSWLHGPSDLAPSSSTQISLFFLPSHQPSWKSSIFFYLV